MSWLIWKELRLNWLILVIPVLVLALACAIAGYQVATGRPEGEIARALFGGWGTNLYLSVLVFALLGGQSIASERVDRSAEFLACQPISRLRIVVSKLVWPAVALILVYGVHSALLAVTAAALGVLSYGPQNLNYLPIIGLTLLLSLSTFAIAWGVSAVQNSPTYAVATGLAVPILVFTAIMLAHWLVESDPKEMSVFPVFLILTGTFAVLSFVGGTWYYLRRVEP